ncbi:MAG: CHAD domain-containing protein [Elusimicrobia bacterium]|nr:CHAD domain-containing protein [Elusimicrobiota bacterium]MBD3412543.1 CHAD domain-containing protein [Elusimicrobiota bacterium]
MKTVRLSKLAKTIIRKHAADFLDEEQGVRTNLDIEYVHRMRVASRRLRGALWTFKELLPSKKRKKIRDLIRIVTKALGPGRDLDTMMTFLQRAQARVKNRDLKKGISLIVLTLKNKRQSVQPAIIDALDVMKKKKIRKKLKKIIDTMRITKKKFPFGSARVLAEHTILVRLHEMLAFEHVVAQEHNIHELHRLRIAARHLRYTLESFKPVYGIALKPFIDAARQIQRLLGHMHNFDVWVASLQTLGPSIGDLRSGTTGIPYLIDRCLHNRTSLYRQFKAYWHHCAHARVWARLIEFLVACQDHDCRAGLDDDRRLSYTRLLNGYALIDQEKILNAVDRCARAGKGTYRHEKHVTKSALAIFDQLGPVHGLCRADRLRLECAGMLHDIGFIDGSKKHHKKSQKRILETSQLMLPYIDRILISLIARYHRRALPKKSHQYYKDLGKSDRFRVRALAGILRIADGLDHAHRSLATAIKITKTSRQIIITVYAKNFSHDDIMFGKKKADLFEKTFNRNVIIDWHKG